MMPSKSRSHPSDALPDDAIALMSSYERSHHPDTSLGYDAVRRQISRQIDKRSGRLIAISALAGILVVWSLLVVTLAAWKPEPLLELASNELQQIDKNVYLLVTSPAPDVNTCKTILSAAVLKYPTPRLLRWNESLEHHEAVRAKFTGIVDFLDNFWKNDFDHDLVVILGEESNTWFQLRPEVFFHRLIGIQARADERLGMKPEQSVLFATEPSSSGDDLVEPALDPRLVVGSVASLRSLYRHAIRRIDDSTDEVNEKRILKAMYQNQTIREGALGRRDSNEIVPHICLDVGGELSHLVSTATEGDATWIAHDMESQPAPLDSIIAESMPPFWTTRGQHALRDKSWSDLSLFTNRISATVPSMIQFDSATESDPAHGDRRVDWWEKLWLAPHGRELLTAYMHIPWGPPIAITVDGQGVEHRMWDPSFTQAGLEIPHGDPDHRSWNDLCGGAEDTAEVFRDDKGPWEFDVGM